MLRKLDKIICFPEETALMLRDFEHALFRSVTVSTLLSGLSVNLSSSKMNKDEWIMRHANRELKLFQTLVCHFYMVRTVATKSDMYDKTSKVTINIHR